ncbi:MAG: bifunctional folylpolyglutamate synthase/dihydrofolate synthase [Lentisphaerae bacterium]|nr:bifunctional folylpolyglutamate synthase/dihydrofolate synthase [Lentisphaerota bacterium]
MEWTAQMKRLSERRRFGIRPGLESEEKLMEALGHPERSFAALHVAGTNGKGSVCALLASMLQTAGYRTGLFTSPHLVALNERFRIDGEMIGDAELQALMERVETAAQSIDGRVDHDATFFECCTAMAFEHFRDRKVQLAVVETGMGGRLDSTNVLEPAVTAITRIDMDHMAYLGDDIATIAAEKAGIIKPGRPVVIGAMCPEAREVIVRTAAERGAPLRDAVESVTIDLLDVTLEGQRLTVHTGSQSYGPLLLPLLGAHQLENLAIAVATVETLRDRLELPISEEAIVNGIEATRWEGRLQVLQANPPLLLDGAHNPSAAVVLVQSLKRIFKKRRFGLILGMCSDKNIRATLEALAPLKAPLWTVPLSNERGISAEDLALLAEAAGLSAEPCRNVALATKKALAWAEEHDGVICIAGSLFLVGDVLTGRKDRNDGESV